MIGLEKKVRAALLIYVLLGVIGIGVCFIIDFVINAGVTWSLYVLYAVPFLFLGMLPLCFHFKHNKIVSLAVLSVLVIPFLYLLDTIVPTSNWFVPLALPVALRFLFGLWGCGIILKFAKVNKWFMSAFLLGIFGFFMTITTVQSVSAFTVTILSPLIMIIGLFSFTMIASTLAVIGYIRGITPLSRKRKAGKTLQIAE